MTKIISFLNFKGGVGKTTSAVNVGKAFHDFGKRVLVIDADAQGNASRMMGFRPSVDKDSNTLYDAMMGKCPIEECILMDNDNDKSFDYIPSNATLYQSEMELVSRMGRETILSKLIDKIKPYYDFIFIDCPPNNGLLSINAMYASDFLIIPLNCEIFAIDGMSVISAKYEEVKEYLNHSLDILGYVMCRYDKRLSLHREALETMEKNFPGKVFETKIRTNIQLAESPAKQTNIFDYDPKSNGAKDYEALAKEIIKKMENYGN